MLGLIFQHIRSGKDTIKPTLGGTAVWFCHQGKLVARTCELLSQQLYKQVFLGPLTKQAGSTMSLCQLPGEGAEQGTGCLAQLTTERQSQPRRRSS